MQQEGDGILYLLEIIDFVVDIDKGVDDEEGKRADADGAEHLAGKVTVEVSCEGVTERGDGWEEAERTQEQRAKVQGHPVAVRKPEEVNLNGIDFTRDEREGRESAQHRKNEAGSKLGKRRGDCYWLLVVG